MSETKSVKARLDAWESALTGLGTAARDKVQSYGHGTALRMDKQSIRSLLESDDIASKIVSKRAREIFRAGYTIQTEEDLTVRFDNWIVDFDLNNVIEQAMINAKAYGGGAVWMIINDGAQQRDPLNPGPGSRLIGYQHFNAFELRASEWDTDQESKNFGKPVRYKIENGGGEVHRSRIIPFYGILSDSQRLKELFGWGLSNLAQAYEALRLFNLSYASTGHLMSDMSQGVFKIKNLVKMITSNTEELQTRMTLLDWGRSVARSLLLDAEHESFERANSNLGGVDSLLDRFAQRLAAAADMPLTVLLGMSPAGLNATGESDIRLFYDSVDQDRRNVLLPQLARIIDAALLCSNGPTDGRVVDYTIDFKTLYQPTSRETAEIRKMTAETDAIYLQNDVVLPAEIALSRFGAGYSTDTKINQEIREEVEPAQAAEGLPVDAQPAPTDQVDKVADAALNGAQAATLKQTIIDLNQGLISMGQAEALIRASVPTISDSLLRALIVPFKSGPMTDPLS